MNVRHIDVGTRDQVTLPQEYLSRLRTACLEAIDSRARVLSETGKAKRIEKEYLHLACNDKHKIKGLDKKTANKICTWREQFNKPYEKALKKYVEWKEKTEEEFNEAMGQYKTEIAQQQAQQKSGNSVFWRGCHTLRSRMPMG